MPAAPGDERPVVPVTAIYGANASGKSNLLDGLSFMRQAVESSFARWDAEGGIPRKPFRLRGADGRLASVFVVELVIDGVNHTYGFTLDNDVVREEWLYSYPEKRRRILFERDGDAIKFGSTVDESKAKRDALRELSRPNALFLSVAAQARVEALLPVYHWFVHRLLFRSGGDHGPRSAVPTVVEMLATGDERIWRRLVSFLSAADVGISDLVLEVVEDSAEGGRDYDIEGFTSFEAKLLKLITEAGGRTRLKLKLAHHGAEELFDLADESAGTRSWIDLLPSVLQALDSGGVLVVDEIDASLHPMLTARLVALFQEEETNSRGAQLVFTTHDTSLLGTMVGEHVLEREQIWFVEKGAEGVTKLYPLSDFKPRKEHNTERRYLAGSYGAVPVLTSTAFADAVLGR
ncbi:ATP-binding protein [Amycolatopsis samaneae]